VGARFSAAVQTDPGVHPASYTMCTGSLPGVKRLKRGVDHLPPSRAEVKERVNVYSSPPLCFHGLLWRDLTFYAQCKRSGEVTHFSFIISTNIKPAEKSAGLLHIKYVPFFLQLLFITFFDNVNIQRGRWK
jgi:hypothetical protein